MMGSLPWTGCRVMNGPRTISKCVILARGLGTRMRREAPGTQLTSAQSAVASEGLKAMIPVGRPLLDYVLSALADAGFRQACLVIGPEHGVVREYYTHALRTRRIAVSFAVQAEALGTANAVLAAKEFAGSDEFLALNGDNYYSPEALEEAQDLRQPGTVLFDANALVCYGNISEERIRAFAYCFVDPHGLLVDIVEKPDVATGADFDGEKLISMNCWRFGPEIFRACRDVPLSPRGEYELPLAVKLAIQRGETFKVAICRAGVLDLSRRSDVAGVTERLRNVKVEL
jgi:dTDP-glucose pyrophosphorylase